MKFLLLAGWSSLYLTGRTLAFVPLQQRSLVPGGKLCNKSKLIISSNTDDDDDNNVETVLYSDEPEPTKETNNNNIQNRWNSLNPKVKSKIIKQAQKRAVMNKEKREPAADKKRQMMMFYKKAQLKSNRESRIERPLGIKDPDRIPLTSLEVDSYFETAGVVISLTKFGAYIDVGTECDGLLHVSQITREDFVEHPRQVFSPGDKVEGLRVVRVSPELKKLQLSLLLSKDEMKSSNNDDDENFYYEEDEDEDEDRIALEDVNVDDELWGEIKRVTSYGSYVELGAAVDGFLHFMDHPDFGAVKGAKPNEYMKVRNRVRVWVSDIDTEKKRIKLTGIRPPRLPGPKRELR